jgi:hypothetical protein
MIWTVPVERPAGIVTAAGTVAIALLLDSVMVKPFVDAAAVSVTVAWTALPVATVAVLSVTLDKVANGVGIVCGELDVQDITPSVSASIMAFSGHRQYLRVLIWLAAPLRRCVGLIRRGRFHSRLAGIGPLAEGSEETSPVTLAEEGGHRGDCRLPEACLAKVQAAAAQQNHHDDDEEESLHAHDASLPPFASLDVYPLRQAPPCSRCSCWPIST